MYVYKDQEEFHQRMEALSNLWTAGNFLESADGGDTRDFLIQKIEVAQHLLAKAKELLKT